MRSLLVLAAGLAVSVPAIAGEPLLGAAAFGDYTADGPGVRRLIRPEDLPAPFATKSASNASRPARRPEGALPEVPDGFEVSLFAERLNGPRTMAVAPNGDVFVTESSGNQIRVLRSASGSATPTEESVFAADDLDYPYGLAFYPPGGDPRYLYVANEGNVVRYPYKTGDLTATGPAETVVQHLPVGGHATRALAFSPDGKTMYVAIGSDSNVGEDMGAPPAGGVPGPPGAGWGNETGRADVIAYDPDGGNPRIYATGIRNCAGVTIEPATGDLWCVTNERDGLGDNLPPDYATRVKEGAFYGWPWYYIGDHPDPRHADDHPDLGAEVTVPDVLFQAHSAPLGIAFYDGTAFPSEYRGDAFVALHGSWNRSLRTGYKLVRLPMKDGRPTGEYEDFLTGFVKDDQSVWGRPVGVAVAKDGALLVSEDGNGTIWRIAPKR